ncbi:ribonuclease HI [Porphyromonas crevioricanis JCM 15906]|uniref:Ribonuclease HII n=1 Tax=Porphyromonas crevioricanis JCM 15906 TaxID=1305617 RepID=T1CRV9_9PORP|nr:ribonuclease HII [Porphyromonas crevioricanis]GAD05828.1 ribonuclease HI [Porphyromonas crevioricanis JCM 15906]SJZ95890.1 RNase HII [Porphyromonas crevioricanis]
MLRSHYQPGRSSECGCDEAGRGCLAGPVFAAAVILPPDFSCDLLNDSKKLSVRKREALRVLIEREALAWSVASVSAEEIDQINILRASFLAMHRAIASLSISPELLLIDGNRFEPFGNLPHYCIVHGDALYQSIAAASILAKTHRDSYMQEAALRFPGYDWEHNMGYPTKTHREAIARLGTTPIHRLTFRLH